MHLSDPEQQCDFVSLLPWSTNGVYLAMSAKALADARIAFDKLILERNERVPSKNRGGGGTTDSQ